jgi:hypothetical protein
MHGAAQGTNRNDRRMTLKERYFLHKLATIRADRRQVSGARGGREGTGRAQRPRVWA